MSTTTNIRDLLNGGGLNTLGDVNQAIGLGELLSHMISLASATPTETLTGGILVSNVGIMAAVPSALFQVNGSAGTHTGIKKLRKGPITGPNAVIPAAGECVWDGGLNILFSTYDAITTALVFYAVSTTLCSITMSDLARG